MRKMSLFVIFGQRKCSYAGEYAIEALEVTDEYSYNDNSNWIDTQLERYKKEENEFDRLAIIEIKVDEDKINNILYPKQEMIDGDVTEKHE